jgi:hypothetical protein
MAAIRPERMNSPLELREVRRRGLQGEPRARQPDPTGESAQADFV